MEYVNGARYPTVTSEGIYGFFREYRWLSNFHLCRVHVQNLEYPSSEHAYMAMKTVLTKYRKVLAHNIESPRDAKAYGQTVPLRPNWEEIRYDKMLMVLRLNSSRTRTFVSCSGGLETSTSKRQTIGATPSGVSLVAKVKTIWGAH
jgi:predicted NAD-dependent protein-ADP-ribosyltransferase YbiA (DUF1768 family)